MIHALALSVPIPAPHLPAALDVGPFVPGVAYTAPKDYYGMPQDAGYAGLINRAQQLDRFNRADFPPLERRAAPEPPPAPLPIAAMPLAAAAADQRRHAPRPADFRLLRRCICARRRGGLRQLCACAGLCAAQQAGSEVVQGGDRVVQAISAVAAEGRIRSVQGGREAPQGLRVGRLEGSGERGRRDGAARPLDLFEQRVQGLPIRPQPPVRKILVLS